MTDYMEEQTKNFMGVLKALELTKDEIIGICGMLKTEEQMSKVLDRLEAKDFKVTAREAMNICGQVIIENL